MMTMRWRLFLSAVILGYLFARGNERIINEPQYLPIRGHAIINGAKIELEIAETPLEQYRGLMFRNDLPKHRGMFFPIYPRQMAQFWMKNCSIPLDIVFIRDARVVKIVEHASPCWQDPCPLYSSDQPVDGVLEIQAGSARYLNLKIGQTIQLYELLN